MTTNYKIQDESFARSSKAFIGSFKEQKSSVKEQDIQPANPQPNPRTPKAVQKVDIDMNQLGQKDKTIEAIQELINKYEKAKLEVVKKALESNIDIILSQIVQDPKEKAQASVQVRQILNDAMSKAVQTPSNNAAEDITDASDGDNDASNPIHNFFLILFAFLKENVDANNQQMMGSFAHMQAQEKNFTNVEQTLTNAQDATQKNIHHSNWKRKLALGLGLGILLLLLGVLTAGGGIAVFGGGAATATTTAAVTTAETAATAAATEVAAEAVTTAVGEAGAAGGSTVAETAAETTTSKLSSFKNFLTEFFGKTGTKFGLKLLGLWGGGAAVGAGIGTGVTTAFNTEISTTLQKQQTTTTVYSNISDQTQILLQQDQQQGIQSPTNNNQNSATIASQTVSLMGQVDRLISA